MTGAESMAAACDHSPQQVCVAEIYADVRGEEMLTDNAATEQALRCLTSVDQLNQHVGVGMGVSRRGAAAAMAKTKEGLGSNRPQAAQAASPQPRRARME